MPRIMITIPRDTADRLAQFAQTERRDPRAQAALFVERALATKAQPPSPGHEK